MDIGQRLNAAIEQSPFSIKGFQRAMEDREVTGSSYASVRRYIGGETEPPVSFLFEAARVLQVRPEWLAFDSGGMTEADERNRLALELKKSHRADRWPRAEALRSKRPRRMDEPIHVDQLRQFDELLDSVRAGDAPWVGDEDARIQLLDGTLEFLHFVTLTRRRLVTRYAGGPYTGGECLVDLSDLRDALHGWVIDEEWLSGLERAQAEGAAEAYIDAALGKFLEQETDGARQAALARILGGAWATNPEVWARKVLGLFADHVTGLGTPWGIDDRREAAAREPSA